MFLKLENFPHVGIKQMINQNKKSVKPPAIVIQCFFWTKKIITVHNISKQQKSSINKKSTGKLISVRPTPDVF